MYENELRALKKAGRFRKRELFGDLEDYASNDYLGLAEDKEILKKSCKYLKKSPTHGSKASQLVNGYHPIFKDFENYLCKLNHFEDGLIIGSGFLANLALFEALARRGDTLLVDKEYHASGIVGTKLTEAEVLFFEHNDEKDLEKKLQSVEGKRVFVAIEGVYSMRGDIANKEIFAVARAYNAYVIVDEAHSSGVIGENLTGVFAHHNIAPDSTHIKMGTLGKAYGSYGAYILASKEVISFLENRAKSLIYATAPSIFDITYAYYSAKKIQQNLQSYQKSIKKIKSRAKATLGMETESLILPIKMPNSKRALQIQKSLQEQGFLVGAIRPPTVDRAILRIILRTSNTKQKKFFQIIKGLL